MKVSIPLQRRKLGGLTTTIIVPFSPTLGLNELAQLLEWTVFLVWEPPSIAPAIPSLLCKPGKVSTRRQGSTRLLEH